MQEHRFTNAPLSSNATAPSFKPELVFHTEKLKGETRQSLELHTAVMEVLLQERRNPAASFTHQPTFPSTV